MTRNLVAIAAAVIALQGCANQAPPPQAGLPTFDEGKASSCTGSKVDLNGKANATATITTSNDGWCGVTASEADGKPFLLGLVLTRPEHGHVLIQRVNDATRVEYTPENRYVGPDHFTVALRPRAANAADKKLEVSVTATMGPGMAAPAPEPEPKKAPAPARRKTTKKR